MNKKNNNEELQSRREFFKKAAKGALPFLGIAAFGPTFLTSCGGGDDDKKNPEDNNNTGEKNNNQSTSLIGNWIAPGLTIHFSSNDGGQLYYYGDNHDFVCTMIESNKGIITYNYNDYNFHIYFIVDGNTMNLYGESDYTHLTEVLTKEGSNNNGGGNNGGGGCNDCSGGCSNGCGDGCSNACYAGCSVQCVGSCTGSCSGSCLQACGGNCSVTCSYRCRSSSK